SWVREVTPFAPADARRHGFAIQDCSLTARRRVQCPRFFRTSKPAAGSHHQSPIKWSDHGMTNIEIKKLDMEETQSGAARVLTFFRDRLLSGELKAGDRLLPERELAAALDVSRPVLREALRALAMLGLLDIQHGRGAFVRSADASVLGQALTLCLAPEPNILDDVLQARIA